MVRRSHRLADVDVFKTRKRDEVTRLRVLDFQTVQTKETEDPRSSEVFDLAVIFTQPLLLAYSSFSSEYTYDSDTSDVVVVVKQCDLELQRFRAVIDRCRHIFQNHVIDGLHIFFLLLRLRLKTCRTVDG